MVYDMTAIRAHTTTNTDAMSVRVFTIDLLFFNSRLFTEQAARPLVPQPLVFVMRADDTDGRPVVSHVDRSVVRNTHRTLSALVSHPWLLRCSPA